MEERQEDEEDKRRETIEMNERLKQEADKEHEEIMGGRMPRGRKGVIDSKALRDMVDRLQSETREEIYATNLDVNYLRREKVFEKKLRPWLESKIDLFMGGPQSDLVEYVLRKVNSAIRPDELISELTRYLDDNADTLVERMWRMLCFELVQGGIRPVKESKQEQKPAAALPA